MVEISGTTMDVEMGIVASSSNNDVNTVPEEILNRLPLHLQRYIISNLPMEDAVRTSVLSKKWRNIWHSLPCLIFDYQEFPNMEAKEIRFEEFINRTLMHHDASTVEELELSLFNPFGPYPKISNEWVSFGLDHMVQHLTIDGMMKDQQRLPNSLFTSRSVVTLDLSIMGYVLKWPTTVFLPNLTELTMRGLIFEEENPTLDLSKSSPLLERLKIMACNFLNVRLFCISAPVENLELTRCTIDSCKVKLRTPRLTNFEYDSQLASGYDFASLSPDFHGFIKFHGTNAVGRPGDDIGRCAVEFYRELTNAAHLNINHWFIQFLIQGEDILFKMKPFLFSSLTSMKVAVWSSTSLEQYKMLIFILSRCPNLSSLKIVIMSRLNGQTSDEPEFKWQDMLGYEMFNSLKYLKVANLWGRRGQMGLVEFLLFKAREVEEIKVVPPRSRRHFGNKIMDISEESWTAITARVLEFRRTSLKANILFW